MWAATAPALCMGAGRPARGSRPAATARAVHCAVACAPCARELVGAEGWGAVCECVWGGWGPGEWGRPRHAQRRSGHTLRWGSQVPASQFNSGGTPAGRRAARRDAHLRQPLPRTAAGSDLAPASGCSAPSPAAAARSAGPARCTRPALHVGAGAQAGRQAVPLIAPHRLQPGASGVARMQGRCARATERLPGQPCNAQQAQRALLLSVHGRAVACTRMR